jgi:hypothetical protein
MFVDRGLFCIRLIRARRRSRNCSARRAIRCSMAGAPSSMRHSRPRQPDFRWSCCRRHRRNGWGPRLARHRVGPRGLRRCRGQPPRQQSDRQLYGRGLWWERARDLSAVIDGMLADPTLDDMDRCGADRRRWLLARRLYDDRHRPGASLRWRISRNSAPHRMPTGYARRRPSSVICAPSRGHWPTATRRIEPS